MTASAPEIEQDETRCCIAGGGPAGIMLGLLLARAGVDVLVLEKHQDFFRDLRGDTIHPSTLELMHELGLLEGLLRLPHQQVREIHAHFGEDVVKIADFSHLPVHCPFVALMPQWDFLNYLSAEAQHHPTFRLRMETEVVDLLRADGRITGIKARTPQGELHVRARLVVGADGRSSIVRERASLEIIDLGAPIDVLWFRLSRRASDPEQSFGFVGTGQFMVLLDRGDYWQCAHVIPKGAFTEKRATGLPAFRDEVSRCTPFLRDRVGELADWDAVKLLTVKVDRLRAWACEGLLCIGDAAHAMSPVGGVGINLAIQDAVAAARLLAAKLRADTVGLDDLKAVQSRRELPTRLTQRTQIFLHEHFLAPIFDATRPPEPPWPMQLLTRFPLLRRIPARMVGLGFRPEHLDSPTA